MRKACYIFLLLGAASPGYVLGQNNLYTPADEERHLIYKNEASGGITLHTAGWGLDFKKGKHITALKKFVFEAEAVGMKHLAEARTASPYYENSKAYVYGKLNSVMMLRAVAGLRKTLNRKADKGGVEIRFHYSGGFVLALAKPVYLDVLVPVDSTPYSYELVTQKYDPTKHFVDNIYGKASFTNGFGEIKPYPGLCIKSGFSFEYSTFDDDIKAIEVGVAADLFPKEIPIMAYAQNKKIFITFYVSLMLGRKW